MNIHDELAATESALSQPLVKVDCTRDISEMAMAALGLLRTNRKKGLQQIKQLVKSNKDLARLVLTTEVEGWTPVHACALRGSKKLLKLMLQSGIDINCLMGQPEGLPARCTLLHVAAQRKDKKVLQYLLNHGTDVGVRDSEGQTPLAYARAKENKDAIKLLLDCGAGLVELQTVPDSSTYPETTSYNHRHQQEFHEVKSDLEPSGSGSHQRRASTDLSSSAVSGTMTRTNSTGFDVIGGSTKLLHTYPAQWSSSTPCLHPRRQHYHDNDPHNNPLRTRDKGADTDMVYSSSSRSANSLTNNKQNLRESRL